MNLSQRRVKVNLNKKMDEGRVSEACDIGDLNALKCLITPENVNTLMVLSGYESAKKTTTALEVCCYYGHIDCVKWLIETMKADLGHALIYSISINNSTFDYLLTLNPDVNKYYDVYGCTPLHVVSSDKMERLLERGADVTAVNNNGHTVLSFVLHRTSILGKDEATARILLLMRYGARVEDLKGRSYLQIPWWMHKYQIDLDLEHSARSDAATGFMCVCRKKGVPKDLARDVVKRMIVPKEYYLYHERKKRQRREPK